MGPKQQDKAGAPAVTVGGLFRTKSLDAILADAEKPEFQLKRALGPFQLTLLGIGAIVGAGIFATIGTAAAGDASRLGAGPALMVSFAITAIVCSFTALCYAEFAAMVPISGSAYTYSYATLGELIAWIIGWDLIIEYAVGNIAVAISWANYFKTFLKSLPEITLFGRSFNLSIDVPAWMSTDYRTALQLSEDLAKKGQPTIFDTAPQLFGHPVVCNLLAVGIVALITIILVWGVRESAGFNAVMVCIKILVLTFFIAVGAYWMPVSDATIAGMQVKWPHNWTPFMPNGWAGVSAGAAVVFFAYIGFDAVSTVAEETRNPQRNLPIGIIGSLIVCTILYIAVSVIFTGLISYTDLRAKLASEQAEPLTMAIEHVRPGATWAVGFVAFGSVIAHTAVLLVFQLGQPRIFFAMARDGLLPAAFYKVHSRFRTPHISTILTGLFVGGIGAFASIDEMVDLTNIGTLFAFILVCAGIIVLKVRDPQRPRPFRVPSGWFWTFLLYLGLVLGVWLVWPRAKGDGVVHLFGDVTLTLAQAISLGVCAILFALLRKHIFAVLGIVSCVYLIYYLPPTSWLRFAAWLNVGFVIYIGYGVIHSRLTGRNYSGRPAEHDRDTAYAGAWLALIGVAMLILTRAFDLWLEAAKKLPAGANADEAFRQVLQLAPWRDLSWFLIVPLALNALLLCPIVIRRARRAQRQGAGQEGKARMSQNLALAVSLLSLAYFGWLAAAHWHKAAIPNAPRVVMNQAAGQTSGSYREGGLR
jgi:APA family basic amino acid/polyamine antiporter